MCPQAAPVLLFQASGVPGELYDNSPRRILPYTLSPANTQPNIIGATAYTQDPSTGYALVGQSGTNILLGLLITPKEHASFGTTGGGPFAPTLTLPNSVQAAFMTMGRAWVTIVGTCLVGDWVVFDNTTGALSTVSPGSSLPSGKSWLYAKVIQFSESVSGGIVAIELNSAPTIPDLTMATADEAVTAKKGAK